MYLPAFVILAILVMPIAFLVYRIKRKRANRDKIKKETILLFFCILLALAVALFGLDFFKPGTKKSSGLAEEKTDTIILADAIQKNIDCGNAYCFEAKITAAIKGDFKTGETVRVETDCEFFPMGKIEIRGNKKQETITAKCSAISTLEPVNGMIK